MRINDIELEINLFDVEFLQRFIDSGNDLDKVFIDVSKSTEKTVYERAKTQCEGIHTFLDKVFGEGCARQVLKNPYDLRECMEVYKAILLEEEKQSKELTDLSGEISAIRKGKAAVEPQKTTDVKMDPEEVQKILTDVVDPLARSVRIFKPAE